MAKFAMDVQPDGKVNVVKSTRSLFASDRFASSILVSDWFLR